MARDTLQAFEAEVEQFPWCFVGMLEGIVWERCGGQGVMLVGEDAGDAKRGDVVRKLRRDVGVGRTVVSLGKGMGDWIRGRNALVKEVSLERLGVWLGEGGRWREGL